MTTDYDFIINDSGSIVEFIPQSTEAEYFWENKVDAELGFFAEKNYANDILCGILTEGLSYKLNTLWR
tara:strand:+ start:311 stop:514 length:204 start_codon:yes stop_codon:yes gene_type:complete